MYDSNERLGFSVGGLGIGIRCNNLATREQLAIRYRPWLHEGRSHCCVDIVCGSQSRMRGRPTPTTTFNRERQCLIRAPGYAGVIDAHARMARLELAAPDVAGIDYFLRAVLALLAHEHDGLLFHAAGLLRDGRVFLFSGQSGVGKSTTVRVSQGMPRMLALGDDLILLLPQPQGWQAWGTPFWNPETPLAWRTGQASSGPVAAVLRLAQNTTVYTRVPSEAEAVAGLLSDLPIVPMDALQVPVLLKRLQRLVQAVSVGELHFRPDASLWSAVDAFLHNANSR